MLHITHGDMAAELLRSARLPGEVLTWRDPLIEGPVPGSKGAEALRQTRAETFARIYYINPYDVQQQFAERDGQVERHKSGEFVLWFESDLFDQLQILQVLEMLDRLSVEPEKIAVCCIDSYPGLVRFNNITELAPTEFGELYERRPRLRKETLRLAKAAWLAFIDSTPERMLALDLSNARQLPFLREAFDRLWQEYPNRTNGLSLLQNRILQALDKGLKTAWQVYTRVNSQEKRVFLDFLLMWPHVVQLTSARHQLIAFEPYDASAPASARPLRITDTGREVLAGEKDHIRINGIDRWIGGVHLETQKTIWRYDEQLATLQQS